jgi:dTDP-4-amino-4,6-dideoxygalactose transaminase
MQTINHSRNPHQITSDFETALCRYTGAPYAVALDNQSNALFLALTYDDVRGKEIVIPARTYPSVPCEIIHAGGIVRFHQSNGKTLKGAYWLVGSKVIDSALRFTFDMYEPDSYQCLSFTGPYKHLKLSKGGAILTDNYDAYLWFKRARFSGRRECSYHDDHFDMLGWNFYMEPEKAARGLLMMNQFYDSITGIPKENEDLELPYPDLSQFSIYQENR